MMDIKPWGSKEKKKGDIRIKIKDTPAVFLCQVKMREMKNDKKYSLIMSLGQEGRGGTSQHDS